MDVLLISLIAGAVGVVLGVLLSLVIRAVGRRRQVVEEDPDDGLPAGIDEVLAALPSAAVVIDSDGEVIKASTAAYALGLVDGPAFGSPQLQETVARVADRRIYEDVNFVIKHDANEYSRRFLHAGVAPLGKGYVLVLCDDETEFHRVEAVRRDFVANVSHELKTPIGAISLLAEAVTDYSDDPEAVHRFGGKIQKESTRLVHLVQEIIDLSQVQDNEELESSAVIEVAEVVEEAIDRARTNAESKNITINVALSPDLRVEGSFDLLAKAVRNLVDNAVNYSSADTEVGISTERRGNSVAVIVTDHGIGMSSKETDRIFERFYRVDKARSRNTGGTGLGLSIVKHIIATHGGKIKVWSRQGEGSTFTVLLPLAHEDRRYDNEASSEVVAGG